MAIIPMRQTITVVRQGEADEWGEGGTTETFSLKCRVDEESKLVRNMLGEEVVASAEITLNKLVDIRYSDIIEYTNELGQTIRRSPIRITVTRMLNGKPILTGVYL